MTLQRGRTLIAPATWHWSRGKDRVMKEPSRRLRSFLVGTVLTLASVSSPAVAQTTSDSTTCDACIDIAIGNDANARLLQFDAVTQRVTFESVDSSGLVTQTGPFGPFSGWTPRADGLRRRSPDASPLDPRRRLLGALARCLARRGRRIPLSEHSWPGRNRRGGRGGIGDSHPFRCRADGAAVVQTIDASGTVTRSLSFGPYSGWRATAISRRARTG